MGDFLGGADIMGELLVQSYVGSVIHLELIGELQSVQNEFLWI